MKKETQHFTKKQKKIYTLDDLPPELHFEIHLFSHPDSLLSLSQTCKLYKEIITTNTSLWTHNYYSIFLPKALKMERIPVSFDFFIKRYKEDFKERSKQERKSMMLLSSKLSNISCFVSNYRHLSVMIKDETCNACDMQYVSHYSSCSIDLYSQIKPIRVRIHVKSSDIPKFPPNWRIHRQLTIEENDFVIRRQENGLFISKAPLGCLMSKTLFEKQLSEMFECKICLYDFINVFNEFTGSINFENSK